METNVMFDVALGMLTFFAAFSLICSAINSLIQNILGAKFKELSDEMKTIGGDQFFNALKDHPLAQRVTPKGVRFVWPTRRGPVGLQPERFAAIVSDLIAKGKKAHANTQQLAEDVVGFANSLPDGHLKNLTQDFAGEIKAGLDQGTDLVEAKLQELHGQLAAFYDDRMAVLSAWYKKRMQYALFAIGLVFAWGANLDTLALYNSLTENPALRAELVAMSFEGENEDVFERMKEGGYCPSAVTKAGKKGKGFSKETCALEFTQSGALPFGWPENGAQAEPAIDNPGWPKFFGFLISALAASLGAPFWFDTIRKVKEVKSSVQKLQSSIGGLTKL